VRQAHIGKYVRRNLGCGASRPLAVIVSSQLATDHVIADPTTHVGHRARVARTAGQRAQLIEASSSLLSQRAVPTNKSGTAQMAQMPEDSRTQQRDGGHY